MRDHPKQHKQTTSNKPKITQKKKEKGKGEQSKRTKNNNTHPHNTPTTTNQKPPKKTTLYLPHRKGKGYQLKRGGFL